MEEADTFEDVVSRRLSSVFAAAGPELPAPASMTACWPKWSARLIHQALQATKGNQIRARGRARGSTETPSARRFRPSASVLGEAIDAALWWRHHMLL
ncbi:MAG: hypothetical protein WDM79_16630 [Terricaulis sp.]